MTTRLYIYRRIVMSKHKTMTKTDELKKAKEILQDLSSKQEAKQEKIKGLYKDIDEVLQDTNQYILITENILYLQKVINHLENEINNDND